MSTRRNGSGGATFAPSYRRAEVLLSPRQRQVLQMLVDGRTLREIRKELGVGPSAVSNVLAWGRAKLGARSTYHALALALELGLVQKGASDAAETGV